MLSEHDKAMLSAKLRRRMMEQECRERKARENTEAAGVIYKRISSNVIRRRRTA